MTRQRSWSPERRSSSPDNGVGALTLFTGPHLGSLHATACAVAHPRGGARQGTWCVGLPGVPTPWVPSLELAGRAARSRGRTSTGKFESIHGMLPGTCSYDHEAP